MNTEVNVTTTKILRFCGKVLFEAAVNTVKAALLLAISSGANLSGANLSGAMLSRPYDLMTRVLTESISNLHRLAKINSHSPPTRYFP